MTDKPTDEVLAQARKAHQDMLRQMEAGGDLDLGQLRAIACYASAGPWFAGPAYSPFEDDATYEVSIGSFDIEEKYGAREDYSRETFSSHHEDTLFTAYGSSADEAEDEAAFVATFNPRMVLRLLGEIEKLQDKRLKHPEYTPEQHRAADYIISITGGAVGAGEDPVGFLLASHAYQAHLLKQVGKTDG